jgi:hypothetical protein
MNKLILAATAALTLAAPLSAAAQDAPSYAQVAYSGDDQIRGRIESFDGAYQLTVRDERGFVDDIELHPGTIINPTGLTLAPGMVVSVIGANQGSVLAANEIDTPYSVDAGVPYYGGRAWDSYGPSVGLAFFFGNQGWWHGNDFGNGSFRYDRGVRVYTNVRIREAGPRPYVAYGNGYRPNDGTVRVNVNVRSGGNAAPVRYANPRYVAPATVRTFGNATPRIQRTVTAPVVHANHAASHDERTHR